MSMAHITHNWRIHLVLLVGYSSFFPSLLLRVFIYLILQDYMCFCVYKRKKIQFCLVFSATHTHMNTFAQIIEYLFQWQPLCVLVALSFSIWDPACVCVSACDWVPEYVIHIPFTSFLLHISHFVRFFVHICPTTFCALRFMFCRFVRTSKKKRREEERREDESNDEKCLKD